MKFRHTCTITSRKLGEIDMTAEFKMVGANATIDRIKDGGSWISYEEACDRNIINDVFALDMEQQAETAYCKAGLS